MRTVNGLRIFPHETTVNPTAEPPELPARKRGCLFYGCLGTVIAGVLLIVCFFLVWYFGTRMVVARFTSATPVVLPATELPADDERAVRDKLSAVYSAFESGEATTLELTAPELNALLAENTELKNRIHVEFEGKNLRGRVSLPLDGTGFERLRGRWLNGDAVLSLTTGGGEVRMSVVSLAVNGQDLPGFVIEELSRQNLVEQAGEDPRIADYLGRITNAVIEGDRLVVRFKAR